MPELPPELDIGIVAAIVSVVVLLTLLRGIKVAKPDEAIIVTSRQKISTDGGVETENAVAVVKVGGSESMVRAAAQRFLNQRDQIESSAEEVLSGSVRSIVGQLTVTEIITNRSALQEQVLEAVRESLDVQGLQIDTLQIKEIVDDNGYIRDLGRGEAARVKQVVEVTESMSRQASEEARIGAEQAVAEQQRKLDLRNAEIQKVPDKARAEAAAS